MGGRALSKIPSCGIKPGVARQEMERDEGLAGIRREKTASGNVSAYRVYRPGRVRST